MKVNILGKQRKGQKSFSLSSKNGYTITAVKDAYKTTAPTVDKFSGVTSIDWQFGGRVVKLSTFESPVDFTKYDEVVIKEGTEFKQTKEVTLGMNVAVDQSFTFGGVKFVKTSSILDIDEDYAVICVIHGTHCAVSIMNTAVVTIEL